MSYEQAFWLTKNAGNNAFAWEKRGANPRLFVPAIVEGEFADVCVGDEVVFSAEDEHDVLQTCRGLKNFVRTHWDGVPTVVVDNHNHVLFFWYEALAKGALQPGATLVHVDQHKDMREAPEPLSSPDLGEVFRYTNEVVNVGNYIRPAMEQGLIGEVQLVTGNMHLDDTLHVDTPNKILNIDLDYFVDEMEVDFDRARDFIHAHLKTASLVTIATSPFFMDQEEAIAVLRRLVSP